MKKNKFIINQLVIIFICFSILSFQLLSKSKNKNTLDLDFIEAHQNNFNKATNILDNYLNKFSVIPKGWKQFKRAEAFWRNRCFENGDMSSAKFSLQELLKFNKLNLSSLEGKKWIELSKILNYNNIKPINNLYKKEYFWEEMGPFTVVTAPDDSEFIPGNGRINCISIMPNNDSTILVGAASGGIWKSIDAGNTWKVIPYTDILSLGIMDIAISNTDTNIMFATTGDASGWNLFKSFSIGILKSTDAGESWSISGVLFDLSDSIYCARIIINPEDNNIVYVATSKSVLKSIDGGQTWKNILTGYDCRDIKFNAANSNIIYVTTFGYNNSNYILVSLDAGETWTYKHCFDDVCRIELATTPADPNLIYVVSAHKDINIGMEGLYLSKNKGKTFDTIMHLNKLENYINLISRQGFYNLSISVAPDNANELLVGGVEMFYSKNSGVNWINILGDTHCDIHRFVFSNYNNKIYVANDGGISFIYRDTLLNFNKDNLTDTSKLVPIHWENITKGLNITQYYRIGTHPYTDKYFLAGSQDNGTHYLKDNYWQGVYYGDGMQCQFHPKRLTQLICSYQRGGGIAYDIKDNFPWITEFTINPATPDSILICGTNVWLKKLGDTSNIIPENISNFPNIDINNELRTIAVTELDKDYIYTSSTNRLYSTKNYGKEWKELYRTNATIVSIEINPNNIDMIWTAHSGHYAKEKVLQFTDTIIKNISYNLPNVSINTLEYYPDENQLFAGTDIGVFVLNFPDTIWQNFNNNLPNVCVNELEYVNKTGYLYAATWGRGAWKCKLKTCPEVIKPKLNYEGKYEFCNPNKEQLCLKIINKIEGYTYFWSNGSTEDSIFTIPGTFYAVAISPEGYSTVSEECKITYKDINILISKPNIIALTRNPNCIGSPIKYKYTFLPETIMDLSWSNNSKDSIAEFYSEGEIIKLYYTYVSGCSDTLIIDTVKYLPKLITPTITRNKLMLICENESDYYEWYYNDNLIYDCWFKEYKITAPGKYYVMLYDSNYCTVKSNEIIIDLGEYEINKLLQAKVTPNPNNGYFILEIYTGKKVIAEISILNIEGKKIKSFQCKIDKYFYYEFDFNSFSAGQYFIKVDIKDYSRTIPFVINK